MNYNCEKLTLYSKVFEKKGLPEMIKVYLIDVNTTKKDSEVHEATYMNYQTRLIFTHVKCHDYERAFGLTLSLVI